MNRFRNIDELRSFLKKDREKSSLCPLRYINVDSMEMWVDVKKLLLSMSKGHTCLSSYCMDADTTPNMRQLIADMKAIKESICISPLSEYLRVRTDLAKSTIERLLSENYQGNVDGRLRIYIPMYRMKSVLQTIRDTDPRKHDCLIFLETGEDTDYSLTIIQEDLHVVVAGNAISGFKQYLQYWEQNPDKPLILHTGNAMYFGENVFFDNVTVIVTSYDLLRYHYHLPTLFQDSDGTVEQWNYLAQVVAHETTFENACCHELLINHFTDKLFEKWASFNEFQKWLLWMWARLQAGDDYMSVCIAESTDVESFVDLLFCKLLSFVDSPVFPQYYVERRGLLAKMKVSVPTAFWQKIEQPHSNPIDTISVLTDLTVREREKIFAQLKDIPESQRTNALDVLRMSYPALANYIESAARLDIEDFPDEFKHYFSAYRWNKAANILPETFINSVQQIARLKGAPVYAMKARNLIVSEEYDENSAIIFVDGMGVEYVEYLSYTLNPLKNEQYSVRARAGYCNLPPTTKINKDYLAGRRVLGDYIDLDEMKHESNQYPQSLMQEMAFLDSLKEKILVAFGSGVSRIILTSDHGTSRMAVLIRKTDFDDKHSPNGHPVYKYGRYCEGVDMAERFPTAIEYDNKLIFADYSRFEQKGAPVDEIHGGASLEEWIVPVIIIDKVNSRKHKLVVTIMGPSTALRVEQLTRMVTVNFTIAGYSCNDVSVRIHGRKIICRKTDTEYMFKYRPIDTETQVQTVVYGGTDILGTFTFAIKKSIAQNSKFDL